MVTRTAFGRGIALLLVVLLVLSVVPGLAAAAESRAGGNVVVDEGETVNGLEAFGGTVVVRGTVDGDMQAFGGNVVIAETGRVTGDLSAFSGNVRIAGTVDGSAEAAGGNINVVEGAEIGGDLSAAGGSVVLAGTVRGDAELSGESVTLAESAVVDGGVEYDAERFRNEGATVGGDVVENQNLGDSGDSATDALLPNWVAGVYGILVNLALGALLLLVFPGFSRRVADRAVDSPLAAGGGGLLTVVATPIVLVLVALTIVGIPLSLLGLFAFLFALWVALVYGGYTVGEWLTDAADVDNRWVALVVGVVLVALAGRLPIVGGLVTAIVTLLGLGALALVLRDLRRDDGDTSPPTATEAPEGRSTAA